MAARPSDIDGMISTLSRYNPGNISVLEEYLVQQCDGSANPDLQANLSLLNLFVCILLAVKQSLSRYQFNPEQRKNDIIVKILLLCMVAGDSAGFSLCLYVLDEQTASI